MYLHPMSLIAARGPSAQATNGPQQAFLWPFVSRRVHVGCVLESTVVRAPDAYRIFSKAGLVAFGRESVRQKDNRSRFVTVDYWTGLDWTGLNCTALHCTALYIPHAAPPISDMHCSTLGRTRG